MPRSKASKSVTAKAKGNRAHKPKMRRNEMRVFASMADADQADREYWWSRTPAERMRSMEQLRQWNFGYGQGRPVPRFQSIFRVVKIGEDESMARRIC